jgi:hypothetical protein
MKELEKMAKDFAETETYVDSRFTASNAFEAGFRKCREMAANIPHPWFLPNPILNPSEHKAALAAVEVYQKEVASIGESEIK